MAVWYHRGGGLVISNNSNPGGYGTVTILVQRITRGVSLVGGGTPGGKG